MCGVHLDPEVLVLERVLPGAAAPSAGPSPSTASNVAPPEAGHALDPGDDLAAAGADHAHGDAESLVRRARELVAQLAEVHHRSSVPAPTHVRVAPDAVVVALELVAA